ncbi:unnamed protein product [Agarophyton chilense]
MTIAFVTSPIASRLRLRRSPWQPCPRRCTTARRSVRACAHEPNSASPTSASSRLNAPPVPSAPSNNSPDSSFATRFGDLRGRAIEPVAVAMERFNRSFARPIPIVYRSVINEMLTTTHLAVVCAMWRFDAVFAFGFDSIFSSFLRFYPDEAERETLYRASASALKLDIDFIKSSAASVSDWLDGKTEDDVFAALNAAPPSPTTEAVGPVIEALAYIRDSADFDWYYSRLFGIGLIQVMNAVGVELSAASAERWADKIGLVQSKFTSEMGAYLSNMERLKQAEQIFAEATAREAKKTAERLAAKAEAAAKEAAQLEQEEQGDQGAEQSQVPSATEESST